MIKRTLIFAVLSLICFSPLSAQQLSSKLNALTEFYTDKAEQRSIVGSALAIVYKGESIYYETYGVSNLETHEPINRQSIFHWASITKTFTGIAIMQLRDRGLLSLDDPVTKYIPSLRKVHNPYGSMDEITIRMLLSHSAGFRSPTWPYDDDIKKRWMPHEPQHWKQLVAMFPYTKIFFEPGTRWKYSNLGIIFLGRIIEKITKDDYEYYIDKNILNPLRMHNSYFDHAPYRLVDHVVQSYYLQNDDTYKKARFNLNTGITASNGGLSASLPDMITYLKFLTGHADKKAYKYVLSRSSIQEMWQPQIKISSETFSNIGASHMGLCFFIGETHGVHLISHSGSQNGFLSHIYIAPEKDIAYVVVYSSAGETRKMDLEMRQYIVNDIFSTLPDTN